MKKIAIGIDGHRHTKFFGFGYAMGKTRMHCWFTAQKNHIGFFIWISKKFQPLFHGFSRQGFSPMLTGIDITMTTGKIAGSENMKE